MQVPRFGHGSRVPGWDDAVDLSKDPAPIPDPATTPVPDSLRAEVEAAMAKYPDRRSAAIPALFAAQRLHGWCSPEAIDQVACVMRLTPGYLTAVATFYDMLDTKPVGRHRVYVCTNISCSLNGADELYERLHEAVGEDDPDINVRHFECLGACDIAPMASVDGVYVGPIALDEVPELVDDIRSGRPPLARKQLRLRAEADTLPMDPGARNQAAGMPHAATPDGSLPPAPTSYGGEMEAPDQRIGDPRRPSGGTTQGRDQPGPTAPIEQAPGGPAQSDEREDPA
jgi:NADH:ubiquinone oxidoreductase subunit E